MNDRKPLLPAAIAANYFHHPSIYNTEWDVVHVEPKEAKFQDAKAMVAAAAEAVTE